MNEFKTTQYSLKIITNIISTASIDRLKIFEFFLHT